LSNIGEEGVTSAFGTGKRREDISAKRSLTNCWKSHPTPNFVIPAKHVLDLIGERESRLSGCLTPRMPASEAVPQ
jgi:hypothetical protein